MVRNKFYKLFVILKEINKIFIGIRFFYEILLVKHYFVEYIIKFMPIYYILRRNTNISKFGVGIAFNFILLK